MSRPLVVLSIALAALVCADVATARSQASTRAAKNLVRRLVPAERRDVNLVRALRLTPGDKPTLHYVRDGALWRCRTFREALVDESRIEGLLRSLAGGVGIVRAAAPAHATEWGFDVPEMQRVAVPDGEGGWDSFDVGAATPAKNGCFVRVTGEREVIAFDADLRVDAGRVPPFVDRTVLSAAWLAQGKGIASIRCAPNDAPAFELEERRTAATPDEIRAGAPAAEWIVKRDGRPDAPAEQRLAASFVSFLRNAPWADVIEASKSPAELFAATRGKLTLAPHEGEPLDLAVGAGEVGAPPRTAVPVLNPFSKQVCAVPPAFVPLLLPRAESLLPGAAADPWAPSPR